MDKIKISQEVYHNVFSHEVVSIYIFVTLPLLPLPFKKKNLFAKLKDILLRFCCFDLIARLHGRSRSQLRSAYNQWSRVLFFDLPSFLTFYSSCSYQVINQLFFFCFNFDILKIFLFLIRNTIIQSGQSKISTIFYHTQLDDIWSISLLLLQAGENNHSERCSYY